MRLSLGRLKNLGNLGEATVVQDPLKSGNPDFSLTDVMVTVHSASQVFFAVVKMKNLYLLQVRHSVKFFHRLRILISLPYVIARCKDVTSIHTHEDPLGIATTGHDVTQMFESIPDAGSLAGRRFQGNANTPIPSLLMNSIDRLSNAFDSLFFPLPSMRARMYHQITEAQSFGSIQLIEQSPNRTPPQFILRRGQVNQVTIVSNHLPDL